MHQNLPQQSCFCLVKDLERGSQQGGSQSHHGYHGFPYENRLVLDDLGVFYRNPHLSGYQDPGGLMGHDRLTPTPPG